MNPVIMTTPQMQASNRTNVIICVILGICSISLIGIGIFFWFFIPVPFSTIILNIAGIACGIGFIVFFVKLRRGSSVAGRVLAQGTGPPQMITAPYAYQPAQVISVGSGPFSRPAQIQVIQGTQAYPVVQQAYVPMATAPPGPVYAATTTPSYSTNNCDLPPPTYEQSVNYKIG